MQAGGEERGRRQHVARLLCMNPDSVRDSESCRAELAKAVKARVVVRTVEASLVSS